MFRGQLIFEARYSVCFEPPDRQFSGTQHILSYIIQEARRPRNSDFSKFNDKTCDDVLVY